MNMEQDFEDFVDLLNKHHVNYLIVGGYALAFHGKPRHSGDLDIWIEISNDNAEKMCNESGLLNHVYKSKIVSRWLSGPKSKLKYESACSQ